MLFPLVEKDQLEDAAASPLWSLPRLVLGFPHAPIGLIIDHCMNCPDSLLIILLIARSRCEFFPLFRHSKGLAC